MKKADYKQSTDLSMSDTLKLLISMYPNKIALNQSEASQAMGVSNSTLEQWREKGVGPQYKKMEYIENGKKTKKGRVLYPITSIAEFLDTTTKTR